MKKNVKFKVFTLATVILLLFSFATKSQNIIVVDDEYIAVNSTIMHKDSLGHTPYDIEDSTFQQVFTNTFSFLIKEDIYYRFRVSRIDRLSNGFGVLLFTTIDGRDVSAYVIGSNVKKLRHMEKIKKGKYYDMKLVRYVKGPIGRLIDAPLIYDVLLQNTLIPVMSIGSFTHLFISDNMIGLNYLDSNRVKEAEEKKSIVKTDIEKFVIDFIQKGILDMDSISIVNMADTFLLRETLLSVHQSFGPSMLRNRYKKPPKKIPEYFKSSEKEKYSFFETFRHVVDNASGFAKYYKKLFSIENVNVDVLFCYNDLYNVRALWRYNEINKVGTVYFSIKKEEDGFKVVGMTRIR